MEKSLTINYCYYNNIELLKKIVDHYKNIDSCNFQIIDDGSPIPIDISIIPPNWSVFRINEDIGWNNEGARNVLMETTNTEWNLLLDMDFIIEKDDIKVLCGLLERLNTKEAYRFATTEQRYAYPCNSFLISKYLFNELGGYDKAFLGMYGTDVTLLAKLTPVPHKISTIYLSKIMNEVVTTEKELLKEEFKTYLFSLESKQLLTLKKVNENNLTRIDWKDIETHKQYYKHFTWSKLQ